MCCNVDDQDLMLRMLKADVLGCGDYECVVIWMILMVWMLNANV